MIIEESRQQVPKRVRKSNATYKEPLALDLPHHEKGRDSQDARNFNAGIASCKAERRELKLEKKPKKSHQRSRKDSEIMPAQVDYDEVHVGKTVKKPGKQKHHGSLSTQEDAMDSSGPVFVKVYRKDLSPVTLDAYELP